MAHLDLTGLTYYDGKVKNAINSNIAPTFSSSTDYTTGEYVSYNNAIYRFTADHSAGAWDSSDVTAVTVGEEISTAKDYALAAYPTKTATGSIVTFDDGADGVPVEELTINIDYSSDGYTGTTVYRTGKNMLATTSYENTNRNTYRTTLAVEIANALVGKTGSFSISGYTTATTDDSYTLAIRIFYEDSTYSTFQFYGGTSRSSPFTGDWSYSFTTTQAIASVTVTGSSSAAACTLSNLQLEVGASATDYEDSSFTSVAIDWSDAAGTIYGGTLDVTTGTLTSTCDSDGTELDTATTYSLDATEVTTVLGDNTVWADTGDTTITYRVDASSAVSSLKEGFEAGDFDTPKFEWINGYYLTYGNVDIQSDTTRISTTTFGYGQKGSVISCPSTYKLRVAMHYLPDQRARYAVESSDFYTTYTFTQSGWFRVTLAKSDDTDIDIGEACNVTFALIDAPANYEYPYATIFRRDGVVYPMHCGVDYVPTVGSDYAEFDTSTTIDDIYTAWSELVSDNSDYMTMTQIGTDESGIYPIYEITAVPYQYTVTNGRYVPKPKILVDAGIHGQERASIYGLYYLFRDICEKWSSDSALAMLRHQVEWVICPCVNPWGYANSSQNNYNGVNINRNFSYGFTVVEDTTDEDYGGTEAESEVETQLLKQLIDENLDAVFYVDFHSPQSTTLASSPIYTYHNIVLQPFNDGDVAVINDLHWNAAIRHIEFVENVYPTVYGTNAGSSHIKLQSIQGHSYGYAITQGLWGDVTEVPANLAGESEVFSSTCGAANVRTMADWILMMMEMTKGVNDHNRIIR